MRKRPGMTLAAVLGMVALGVAGWILAQPPEPVYEGKPISYWLAKVDLGSEASSSQSLKAIHAIGVAGIPFIVAERKQRDSWFYDKYRNEWRDRLPWGAGRFLPEPPLPLICDSTAAWALAAVGPDALPRVVDCLKDKHEGVRVSSLLALRKLRERGTDITSIIPELILALKDPSPDVRETAARTLGKIGPGAAPAIRSLVRGLSDSSIAESNNGLARRGWMAEGPGDTVQAACARALGQIGPPAREAIPALTRLVQDPNSQVSISAIVALRRIDPQITNTIPLLLGVLRTVPGEDWPIGEIGEMGLDANEAMPLFLEALKRRDSGLQSEMAKWFKKTSSK